MSMIEEIRRRLDEHDADALSWIRAIEPSDVHYLLSEITRLSSGLNEAKAQAFEEAEICVPSSWLDPMLSGKSAIGGKLNCQATEAILKAVRQRIKDRAAALRAEVKP